MRVSIAIFCFAFLFGVFVSPSNSQATQTGSSESIVLTNRAVLSMVKDGLPADVVVAKIKVSSCRFDTSPAELEKLKAATVPDSVILAMVEAPSGSADAASADATPVSDSSKDTEENGKPRIYITDSQSWFTHGGFGAYHGVAAGASNGGSSPQTVELIKTFGQRCPQVVVTEDRERAAFVILFDRESSKGFLRRRDKIAVFRGNGDALYSNSVHSVGSSVKDACHAIAKDFAAHR